MTWLPTQTGPVFEVGNDVCNPTTGRWHGVGFQPAFPDAHAEALECATGIVELIRIARDFGEGQQ